MSTIVPVPKDYPPEIIGYAQPWIVSPGQEVEIKISSTEPEYKYRTYRYMQGYESEKGPPVNKTEVTNIPNGSGKGRYQIAHIGSYGIVQNIGLLPDDTGLSFSLYVQPHLPVCDHVQTLISNLDASSKSGAAIVLNQHGAIDLWIGIGTAIQIIQSGFTVAKRRWFKIDLEICEADLTATFTPKTRGTEPALPSQRFHTKLDSKIRIVSDTPLILAAGQVKVLEQQTQDAVPTNKFNGRIDSPIIKATGVNARVLATYDFSVEIPSDNIYDTSGNDRQGVLVNAPSRAMKGHDWDGTETDWSKAKYGYGAIHFHEDDLDDACWETDFVIKIPEDARSGAYWVEVSSNTSAVMDTVTFFVRPTEATTSKLGAKVAIVLSTFTYLAYANEHMFDPDSPARVEVPNEFESLNLCKDETFYKQDRRRDLGLAHYDVHKDLTGVIFSSAKRPLLNCRPGYINWWGHRPRELSAELIMVGFLERLGIPYDVVTDHDLHLKGVSALSSYTTAITGCHPEYPTLQSYTAYEDFVKQGGNMMYLGGNGFYWVSATDPKRPHRSEVRRGGQGVRTSCQEPGERNHSLTGQLGGLWRDCGKAANHLVGIGCCGEGAGPGVPYRRKEDLEINHPELSSWMFRGIPKGDLIGENSLGSLGGGASADEIDRMDFAYGSPSNIIVVASSTGHPDTFGLFPEDIGFPMMKTLGTQTDLIRSDITYYQTSGGGAVFSVGSISWYCALGWDDYKNNIATLTENVLREFVKGI
ncbi:hypothetical protein BP6252_13606 [Coleophoma cylindrospora]|uniref:N,N-dimethylformamidase beta subunit-like C-terminal domain-containing protein n=1 Tax=Coleophoma cylindrospora TaxID=1849047 RepID=A0A3D8Q8N3_9HELO|nr:hypothetical protein BP6252_13606 [Coleophoma cylindrospora]